MTPSYPWHNIEQLRQAARRYLPRLVFDYIEGGVDDEACLRRNRQAFEEAILLPSCLVDVTTVSARCHLFGQDYDMPLGVAPAGLAGFARHGADAMLARAAARANVPFVLSGAGTASVEAVAKVAPQHTWFQLYVSREQRITDDMILRAQEAGVRYLVVTVDVPVHSNRERDVRNGFVPPVQPTASALLNMLGHPRWLMQFIRHGLPRFENWAPYAPPGAGAKTLGDIFSSQIPFTQTWRDLERLRSRWPGVFVVKGLLHVADAKRAMQAGADGLILSNHGGRVLDCAPSPLAVLPQIRAELGDQAVLMVDSGVRRGADIIKARALGADFVWAGRPLMYGVAAGGEAGAACALSIFKRELMLTLAQLGGWPGGSETAAPPERIRPSH